MDRSDLPYNLQDYQCALESGRWFNPGRTPEQARHYLDVRRRYSVQMAEILAAYDPPAVAREIAGELGLQFFIWLDLFDEYYPGLGSRFLRNHPWRQWASRDGQRWLEGLRAYGYPDAVADKLATVEELMAYAPDGFYCCTSWHSRHKNRAGEYDIYGFEEPVVERYRARHGIDIRTDPFDRDEWLRIKGEFVTEFLARMKARLAPQGMKLMLPLPYGDVKKWDYPLWTHKPVADWHTDWRGWIDAGIADSLILGEYQPCWKRLETGYWEKIARDVGVSPEHVWSDAAATVKAVTAGRCELYYWSTWMHGRESISSVLDSIRDGMNRTPLDGAVLHELASFEQSDFYPQLHF
jgi:hypothetical protein